MDHAIEQTGLTILGGLIAGGVGVWTARWQRGFEAKNEFRVFVSVTKGRIPKEGFIDFHNTTKKEIRDATSRLIPTLCPSAVQAVETTCAAYADIEDQSLEDQHENDLRREAFAKDKMAVPPKPSDILKTHLDKLYESIK